jgi:hypothetical protein
MSPRSRSRHGWSWRRFLPSNIKQALSGVATFPLWLARLDSTQQAAAKAGPYEGSQTTFDFTEREEQVLETATTGSVQRPDYFLKSRC